MPKQLYEEALADVRSLRDVAEDNAKRAVVEAVVPRIRDLIEQQLMSETAPLDQTEEELLGLSDEDVAHQPTDPLNPAAVRSSPRANPTGSSQAAPVPVTGGCDGCDSLSPGEVQQPPQQNGSAPPPVRATEPEDVDALAAEEDEYVLDMDSIEKLTPVVDAGRKSIDLETEVVRLEAQTVAARFQSKGVSESKTASARIRKLLSRVEHTYDHVQESVADSKRKVAFENRLERLYKELNQLKESTMRKLREADEDLDLDIGGDEGGEAGGQEIKFTLTGVTAEDGEINLDNASIEMETGVGGDDLPVEDGDGDSDDLDLGGSEDGDDLDLGGDDDDNDLETADESTVVEIDESMLVRELKRMRRLNEAEKVPSTKGTKPGSNEFDDFGDASDDGEPLNKKIRTEGEKFDADECDEAEDEDEKTPAAQDTKQVREGLQKEHRLQMGLKQRMRRLQAEGMKTSGARRQQYRNAWLRSANELKESRIRTSKYQKRLNEASNVVRSNTGTRRPAEQRAADTAGLRKQLAEQNLLNAKLIYTNKLLQNESLNARQKAAIIERLDEATTVRDAKLVYESLLKTLTPREEKLTESRVMGSSSRPTTQSSPKQLNEGFEAARWAKLAGINK